MALIYLKGTNKPVYIEDSKARALKADFDNNALPERISIDALSCLGDQIKSIFLEGEKSKEAKDIAKDINDDYLMGRAQILAMPVADRAKRLGFFELMYYAFYSVKNVHEDILAQATQLQAEFFEKYPNRLYPDPFVFKGLITKTHANETALRIMERVIGRDMACARFNN